MATIPTSLTSAILDADNVTYTITGTDGQGGWLNLLVASCEQPNLYTVIVDTAYVTDYNFAGTVIEDVTLLDNAERELAYQELWDLIADANLQEVPTTGSDAGIVTLETNAIFGVSYSILVETNEVSGESQYKYVINRPNDTPGDITGVRTPNRLMLTAGARARLPVGSGAWRIDIALQTSGIDAYVTKFRNGFRHVAARTTDA